MTAEEIKLFLSTPAALFVLMIFGSMLSMFKQLKDARANGSAVTTAEYLFTIETVLALGGNVIAFIALIMTDTLNFTGALGIGYAMNSLADFHPIGRSAMIIEKIPNGPTE